MITRGSAGWGILAASAPMFVVSLNNLVVTNALTEIGRNLDTNVTGLQWVINGYVLAFAGLLLTGAAMGDRYGRRRIFVGGILLFVLGSVGCALSESVPMLVAARVLQGAGAAAVQPISLTLLATAAPAHRRSAVIGIWGGVNGLGIALGPLVGGAVTQGIAWQWIFWINVPIGLLAVPLALKSFTESRGADRGLDLRGMLLATAGVTIGVSGIVRASDDGWTSATVLLPLALAALLLTGFVWWERHAPNPLLPLRFYRIPAFVLSNICSLAMFFGVFGSIFFLSQFLQGPMRFDPLQAGIRTLPWTAMPMLIAPLAGAVTDRVGGGRLMALGLAMQCGGLAWIAAIARVGLAYGDMVPALVIAGVGMGLTLAPTAAVVLATVRPQEAGKASGANNTVRELGGALGVAVLTTVFSTYFRGPELARPAGRAELFTTGMVAAIWVGVGALAVGAVAALFIRSRRPATETEPPAGERSQQAVGLPADAA